MLAGLGAALVNRVWFPPLQVVDGHEAVVEAHRQQVGALWVDVEACDPGGGGVDVFWEGWVLQGVAEQHPSVLLTELI